MEKWVITPRQRCDLELLLVGAFAPLTGFLSQTDYESVLASMRLTTGHLWPIPINLDVSNDFAERVSVGNSIVLCDADNTDLAIMTITDKWQPDKLKEINAVFLSDDQKHPGVDYIVNQSGDYYLGGPVELVNLPKHYDFKELRHTPQTLKQLFFKSGWKKIIGFQTRNPLHRAHMELTLRAARQIDGKLLLHPVVGLTKPGDIDYFTRVRCYQKLLSYYPEQTTMLSLLSLAMRMAGPREALWHALIRKNYGCTHFIVGRDHAGPGNNEDGVPFYEPYAAQKLLLSMQDEIGITILPFPEMVYVAERKQYCASTEVKVNETALHLSGTEVRNALINEKPIPDWFSFPEIINELRQAYPAKYKKGFTIFFTGLSGSGKSTLAQALLARLMSLGKRNVSILDGDVTRRILSQGLGFTKEDRDINIKRIGFVAAEITKAGGIAICAAIAPYTNARNANRQLISQYGGYVEIYLSTSLYECEKRDPKGLYAKVRNNELKGFTGVDDPYESPKDAEITIDTSKFTTDESVEQITDYLVSAGYLKQDVVDLPSAQRHFNKKIIG